MTINSDSQFEHDVVNVRFMPFRRLELALHRIIDMAIPQHLNDLEQHKININKFCQSSQWDLLLKEQIKASQTIKMIKNDIKELENLKNKVIEEDFEKLTQRIIPVRNKVTEAVNEFLELNVPVMMDPCISLDQANVNDHDSNENLGQNLQIHADNQQKKSYLISWNSLTKELFDLSAMVNSIATLLVGQKEQLNRIEDNIDESGDLIAHGTRDLAKASALKATFIPMTAALIGTVFGGPIGAAAGLKFGIASAFGCGILGYAGGKMIQKKTVSNINSDLQMIDYLKNDEKSKKDD